MLVALECALTAEGFEVVTAERGAQAWLRMAEQAPDLIVTDYKMPGLTGLELCRQLRARVAWSRIPVILYTAANVPLDTRLYDLRIMKPADLDELVREIRALLASATHQELI
jgi:two-component system, OmpR family, phosphate regulon response regulator PhoB